MDLETIFNITWLDLDNKHKQYCIVYLVIASDHGFIRYFFYEAFPFSFTNVEIET